jgi:hypothetical protein
VHTKNATVDNEKRTTNTTTPRKEQYKISNGTKTVLIY